MSAAYDRLSTGYWNSGLRSGANPGGLSGVGAMRDNWEPALADVAAVAGEVAANADDAAAAAASALNAPGTSATSTTNIAPPAVGDVVAFGLQQMNKAFVKGQSLIFSKQTNALVHFIGVLLEDWNSGAGTGSLKVKYVDPAYVAANNAWNVGLSAPIDGTLTGRVAALEAADALQRSRRRLFEQEIY